MSNFRRRLMMSFEKKYTPVKYLESTGTQYIDTGVENTIGFGAELSIELTSNNGVNKTFIGSSLGDNERSFFDTNGNGNWRIGVGTSFSASSVKAISNVIYNLKISTISGEGYIKLNNQIISQKTEEYLGQNYNVYLFARNLRGFVAVNSSIKLYSCKIYNSLHKLVRDYIPVIDSTSRPCLYDKVEDKFYYNKGSGEFLYE